MDFGENPASHSRASFSSASAASRVAFRRDANARVNVDRARAPPNNEMRAEDTPIIIISLQLDQGLDLMF